MKLEKLPFCTVLVLSLGLSACNNNNNEDHDNRASASASLTYTTYNPQKEGIFPVSSTLISTDKDAILVDAQFSVKDGEKLVKSIQESGKNLSYIIITTGDPDYYFGLQPLVKAFPNAQVVATPSVVQHIQETKDDKLAFWGPILKDGAPSELIVPTALKDDHLQLGKQQIEIKASGKYASYLWVPHDKTLLGGVGISAGIHVWAADTQSLQSRDEWRSTLAEMKSLKPKVVIPGHFIGNQPAGTQAIDFTSNYLVNLDTALAQYKDSTSVIATMKATYPDLSGEDSLETTAKVLTGEMPWPQ